MAGADGRDSPALIETLRREPYRFDVRQAIRLLEAMADGAVPLGAGSDPAREAVRLRASLTRSFPPSDIEALVLPEGEGRAELTATFMGLAGAFGPLPPPLTTHVIERLRRRDPAARDFLDIFNHRLISLLLRQWRLFQPALQGNPANPDMPARLPLLALLGLAALPRGRGPGSAEGRFGRLVPSLLEAAGLLNRGPVSAHALARLLAGHFGVAASVTQLRGGWLPLATDQRSHLGQPGAVLGRQAVVGTRVWDQTAGIHIALGPMGAGLMRSFLPGRDAHRQAARLLALPLGEGLDVTLSLAIHAAEVPSARLGRPRRGRPGARLGWSSWLGSGLRTAPGVAEVRLAVGVGATR